MNSINSLDLIILSIIGFSTLLAFFRGLITEFLSLVVWTGAFYLTAKFSPDVSVMLTAHVDDPFRSLLAFGITFLGALFLGGLLNIFITLILRFLRIAFPDRLLGLVFGFLRGMIVVGIGSLLLSKTPLADKKFSSKITDEIKTWQSDSGFKAKIAPTLIDILSGDSKLSGYAVEWGNTLSGLLPNDFLKQMDSANLLPNTENKTPQKPSQEIPAQIIKGNGNPKNIPEGIPFLSK